MLRLLSGRTHSVRTGICLAHKDSAYEEARVETSKVTFRMITDATIDAYFAEVDPLDKAGAYAIQTRPDLIIDRFSGSRSNVIGLPLEMLADWLREVEVALITPQSISAFPPPFCHCEETRMGRRGNPAEPSGISLHRPSIPPLSTLSLKEGHHPDASIQRTRRPPLDTSAHRKTSSHMRVRPNYLTSFAIRASLSSKVFPFAEKSSRFLARLLAVGLLLFGLVSIARADLTSGLVAYYPFDGNASDMSGNGNHGTVHGATSGADRHGMSGKAYTFDGANDYIQSSSATVTGTAYTITAWIKMNQSSNGPIVTLGYGGNLLKNLAFLAEVGQRLHIGTPGANGISGSSVNISVGEWTQTIVTSGDYAQNQTFFYANGIKYSATSKSGANYPFPLNNSSASIGKYVSTANTITFFSGSIDEVRIYDRALSNAEVASLYQLEKPNAAPVISEGGPLTLSVTEDSGPVAWKTWDRRFGGSGSDTLSDAIPTQDGGYLLVGDSNSSAGGEKSDGTRGGKDYWAIKIDANGSKLWDKRFGGSGEDLCKSVVTTSDGGFLLAGSSNSGGDGDKNEPSRGSWDYWAVKIDSNGSKVWDKRFGGSSVDQCFDCTIDENGNFLLAGYSNSGASGDRSEGSRGDGDYWIVKINNDGEKIWDKRFGGNGGDHCFAIKNTEDGNHLVSGRSYSPANGDKSQGTQGGWDIWTLKINSAGNKIWDKRFGGDGEDNCFDGIATTDGGYLLVGESSSAAGADKSQNGRGSRDYWAVKIDSTGNKLWDKRFGGTAAEVCSDVVETPDGGYLLLGNSPSGAGGDKSVVETGGWMVKSMPRAQRYGTRHMMAALVKSLRQARGITFLRVKRTMTSWR